MSWINQVLIEISYLAGWFLALQLLAVGAVPFTATLFKHSPDRGYALSKSFGLLLVGYLCWLIGHSTALQLGRAAVVGAVAFVWVLAVAWPSSLWGGWKRLFKESRRQILTVELLTCGTFLVLALICSFKPEVFWGEKPMDSSFLSYFVRLDSLPPDDPWAAGQKMQYYYLGYLLFAIIHKLTAIPAEYGYNLAVVSVSTLYIVTCFGLLLLLCRKIFWALFGALAVGLLSNLQGLYLVLFAGRRLDFDQLFWPTTRLFTSPAFAEYPIWSFLFADLHPHFMTMPYTVLLLALTTLLLERQRGFFGIRPIALRLAIALVFGSLTALNSWDLIAAGMAIGLALLLRPFPRALQQQALPLLVLSVLRVYLLRLAELLLMIAVAIVLYMPIWSATARRERLNFGWVTSTEFNQFQPLFMYWGVWLLPSVLAALLLYSSSLRLRSLKVSVVAFIAALLTLMPALGLGIYSSYFYPGLALTFFGSIQLLAFCSVFCVLAQRSSLAWRSVAVMLLVVATLLIASEVIFLMDRANTIFKFYVAGWSLLGIATIVLLSEIAKLWRMVEVGGVVRSFALLVMIVSSITFLWAALGSGFNIYVQTAPSQAKALGPRPTLNGFAFLDQARPEDAALVRWLNEQIVGTPTILEAQGPSYQLYSRICMYTGLPTVLGWEYHVSQRNPGWRGIGQRRRDIAEIYNSADAERTMELLGRYQVALIVVGLLEQRTYSEVGLRKFRERTDLFKLLFETGDSAIFAPRDSELRMR